MSSTHFFRAGRLRGRRRAAALAVAVGIGAALTVSTFGTPASAVTYSGALELHGPGTVFAGSTSFATSNVAAGAAASYAVLIHNTGSTLAQFKLKVDPLVNPTSIAALSVKVGSAQVAAQASDPDGYYTPPIAAGKTLAVTVAVTPPKTATSFSEYFTGITLDDLHGNQLDTVLTETLIKATTGSNADLFVSGSGQQPVIGTGAYVNVTNGTQRPGGSGIFTVKVQNDFVAPTVFTVQITNGSDCPTRWSATARVGSTNVTAAVVAGTYTTPSLAKGKSVSIAVTVKYLSVPTTGECDYPFNVQHVVATSTTSPAEQANLITNATVGFDQSIINDYPGHTMVHPVAVNDYRFDPDCSAGIPCDSPLLLAPDGSATMQLSPAASVSNGFESVFFQTFPITCTSPGGAMPANIYISTPDNTAQLSYNAYGPAADAAYAAGGSDGTDHLCYQSGQPFVGYYPSSGQWTGNYANDADTLGTVPLDPGSGTYLGLLPTCLSTGGIKPCLAGSGGSYTLTGPRHSYNVTVLMAADDSPNVSD